MSDLSQLSRLWAGNLFGTNTGTLYLELAPSEPGTETRSGLLRVSDNRFGISIYDVTVREADGQVHIAGRPKAEVEGVAQGEIEARAARLPNGNLSGEWSSTIGSAGTFDLYPHHGLAVKPDRDAPEQIYTSNKDVGALRLYKSDVHSIIETMRRKFPTSRIVVTFLDRGSELSIYSEEFLARAEQIERLNWIKLAVQSAAGGGFSKSLTIDLGQNYNRVTTQGPDESWVLGEAEATVSNLSKRERRLSTAIGKYRVNVNQLIFLGAIIAMPELPIMERTIFVFGVLIMIFAANKITDLLVPHFRADLQSEKPNAFAQIWPSALSWLISATSGLVASLLFEWLR